MIRTEKQLKVTKEKVAEFEHSLAELEKKKENMDSILHELEESGLVSMLQELKTDIEEYVKLSSKDCKSVVFSFEVEDFPDILIKARLVKKMSQAELGKKIGVDAQAIQRYEANGYDGVGFERLLEIKYALELDVKCKGQILNNEIFQIGEACNSADVEAKEIELQNHTLFGAKAIPI